MKKKLVSVLLSVAMTAALLTGCGSGDAASTTSDAAATEEAADDEASEATEEAADDVEVAEEEIPTSTFGDPNGTHLEMWTFVELHGQHYGDRKSVV